MASRRPSSLSYAEGPIAWHRKTIFNGRESRRPAGRRCERFGEGPGLLSELTTQGLHAQGEARRGRGQSLFQQGYQASAPVAGDHHARWLRCLAPRGARDEGRRIRKGQFDLTELGLKEATAPAIWNAVLSIR
jgi:hypothetical protein